MSEVRTATAILSAVSKGPAWHGPAVLDVLNEVTAADAARRPLGNGHTIWELVAHMSAWQDFAIKSLQGEDVELLSFKEDWPALPAPTSENWDKTVQKYEKGAEQIGRILAEFDELKLSARVPGKDYTYKVLVHGIAHHNLYHAGQIALLKKAIAAGIMTREMIEEE